MIAFDYLHDPATDTIERLRAFRIPPELTTFAYSAVASVLVLLLVGVLLHVRLSDARDREHSAELRFDESRVELSSAKLERTNVEALLDLDRRLRGVRLSGVALSTRLADIANHMPRRAWLSEIADTSDGVDLVGEAEGLVGLSDALDSLMTSRTIDRPRLVRAAVEDRSHGVGVLGFELDAGGHR